MQIRLQASSVDITINKHHPNKMNFVATLCYIDQPSDAPPCGTNGKKLVLTRSAVENGIETMNLMGINVSDDFTGHNPREKVGVIEKAYVEGDELKGIGFIYAHDFPDVAYMIKNAVDDMGFSIEACITRKNEDENNVYAEEVTFTGVCMLWAKSAAFKQTYIDYIAASQQRKDDVKMTEEQMKEFMKSIETIVQASADKITAEVDAKLAKHTEETNANIEQVKASMAVQASEEITPPAPKAGQGVVFAGEDKDEFDKVLASQEMSIEDKLDMVTKRYVKTMESK